MQADLPSFPQSQLRPSQSRPSQSRPVPAQLAGPTAPEEAQPAIAASSRRRVQGTVPLQGKRAQSKRVQSKRAGRAKRSPAPLQPLLDWLQRSLPAATESAAQGFPKAAKPKRIDTLFKGNPPNSDETSAAESLWGSRLLFNLVLVRPWILVSGFWLLLIGTSAIALSGLANPGEPTARPGEVVEEMQPLDVAPDTAVTSRLAQSPAVLDGYSEEAQPQASVWPLWVLVVACAGGCLLLSSPERLANGVGGAKSSVNKRAIKRHGAQASRRGASRSLSNSRPQNSRSRSLLKPQYPGSQVMAVSRRGTIEQVTPTQAKPLVPPSAAPVSFAVGDPPNHAPKIAVLPASESHPLDWKEGSLAHRLDVRHGRSLKSFL